MTLDKCSKVEVPIGDLRLVAFINDWEDELPKEIFVSLFDKDDRCVQDICMVREHYHTNRKTFEPTIDSKFVDCRVWGDSDSEDYTHEFTVGIRGDEDEEKTPASEAAEPA